MLELDVLLKHSAVWSRRRTWHDVNPLCRLLYGRGKETLSHLAESDIIRSTFSTFIHYENPQGPKLIYIGPLQYSCHFKVGLLYHTHSLIWKIMLIARTRLETCGERVDKYKIAQSVLYRSAVKMEVYMHRSCIR